jgi:hypothetical protein
LLATNSLHIIDIINIINIVSSSYHHLVKFQKDLYLLPESVARGDVNHSKLLDDEFALRSLA